MTHIVDHMVQRYVEGYVRDAQLLPNGLLTVKHPWIAHRMPELAGVTMQTIPSPGPSVYEMMAEHLRQQVDDTTGVRRVGKLPELALGFGQGGRGTNDYPRVTKDHTK